jgi:hypothetical protein
VENTCNINETPKSQLIYGIKIFRFFNTYIIKKRGVILEIFLKIFQIYMLFFRNLGGVTLV